MGWAWRSALAVTVAALLPGCDPTEGDTLSKTAIVETALQVPDGAGGSGWAFLYAPSEGPPGTPAVPLYASAVSAERLKTDPRAVFAPVAPNPYRLWGLLDSNRNYDPTIDVLAQPGAGDWVTATGTDLELQPGKTAHETLAYTQKIAWEPPAFHLEGVGADLQLDANPNALLTLTLVADPLDRLDPTRTTFHVGLVDANGDGLPDDANQDGIPDLDLTVLLRLIPLPGQVADGVQIVVPLVLDPSPFLSQLNGNVGLVAVSDRLQATLIAQAYQLVQPPGQAARLTPIGAPLKGEYELDLLVNGGQFWRLPNQLAPQVSSQAVRLHFDRAAQ